MRPQAPTIRLSDRQRAVLEEWVRDGSTPQRLAQRARIILRANNGETSTSIARSLGVNYQRAKRWRRRWVEATPALVQCEAKQAEPKDFAALVLRALSDHPRPGVKPKFTPEQVTRIIALACESPDQSARPINAWTPRELAMEAEERGIVDSISVRQMGRFFKRSRHSST